MSERPGAEARTWLGEPSVWQRAAYRFVRFLIFAIAKVLGRVTVVGSERIPSEGPFVLAPVHRSNIDFALASIVTKRRMRYMGKDSIWKSKLAGRMASALGAFPVHRGGADRESLRVCSEVIANGEPVVMFPEGQRRSGPVVEDLFDGPSYVATRAGVPIVPVGIGGSERMMPKGAKFLHPTKLVLIVGEPIVPPPRTEGGRVPRSAVREVTEVLRDRVQALFDEAQARTGRPN